MFERYSERARRVVFFAQEEAAKRRHGGVAAEHLLLAALREKDTVFCRILHSIGVSVKNMRREVEQHIAGGGPLIAADMALADSARRVFDYANEEAQSVNNDYIGTEHLLLGLIREGMDNSGELTGRVLRNAGVDLEQARREVLALQDADGTQPLPPHGTRLDKYAVTLRGKPLTQEDTIPHGAQAFASSRNAAKVFEREYQKLSPEQQAAMQTNGLPLVQLSKVMREMLRFAAQPAPEEDNRNVQMIRNADGLMRVRVEPLPAGTRYEVSSDVTVLTTMLVQDDVA